MPPFPDHDHRLKNISSKQKENDEEKNKKEQENLKRRSVLRVFAALIFCEVSIAVACLTGTGVVERQGAKVVLALPSLRLQIISCDCTFFGSFRCSTSHHFRGLHSRPLAAPAVPVYGRSRQLSLFSIPGCSLAVLATVAFGSLAWPLSLMPRCRWYYFMGAIGFRLQF